MIDCLGKKYLTEKEASRRYGMSTQWFKKRRHKKLKPEYVQFVPRGTVMYPVEEVDAWFKKQIEMKLGG